MSTSLNSFLVAPGATRGESLAAYTTAVVGAAIATALMLSSNAPPVATVVVAVLALDLFGGAVVNATHSAKLRFHGPGRSARHHLGFVAAHIQPFVLALVVPDFTWATATAVYGVAVAGATGIATAPAALRRAIAFALTALGLLVVTSLLGVPGVLAWFAPVLLIKLLLSHMLPEEAEEQPATSSQAQERPIGATLGNRA